MQKNVIVIKLNKFWKIREFLTLWMLFDAIKHMNWNFEMDYITILKDHPFFKIYFSANNSNY